MIPSTDATDGPSLFYKDGPELFFGVAAPIGCDVDSVTGALEDALKSVDYEVVHIRISNGIVDLLHFKDNKDFDLSTTEGKIDGGNKVCQLYNDNSILSAKAIKDIRIRRQDLNEQRKIFVPEVSPQDIPVKRCAYIIRQLKRIEEVDLLSKTYGKHFVQISITNDFENRLRKIKTQLMTENPGLKTDELDSKSRAIISRDENEISDQFGQRLSDIFPLGDIFIDARSYEQIKLKMYRFINAFFGRNDIAPTKFEFGSYMAKAASLRSVDLSRQVGAAILSVDGDIIAIGCNEVPKPGGGNFWDDDKVKSRDIDRGSEANKEETNRIIFDFLKVLEKNGLLKESIGSKDIFKDPAFLGAIQKSMVGEITEYGRMVHAEMNAISDAARLGRSVQGAKMFVTTFPCHNCAKHIIASGISVVIYIEPYPKSRAELLYGDSITHDENVIGKVVFRHFSGISPRRYRDIFEKGKRRSKDGSVEYWYEGKRSPRIGDQVYDYWDLEAEAVNEKLGNLDDQDR